MGLLYKKQVVLGVTGSIAAYKALSLARLLTAAGASVYPILTPSAARFVGPQSFASLCGRPCMVHFAPDAVAGHMPHVELGRRADLIVVAPAGANALAQFAHGLCQNALSALFLASAAPKVVAPAMESGMWNNPATRANIATLQARGIHVVPPQVGALASGHSGVGRLAPPSTIAEHAVRALRTSALWQHQRVLVTAGPTREALDPARFLSNAASGRMGMALARAAWRRGATVRLICGPTQVPIPQVLREHCVRITTCAALLSACDAHLEASTMLLMAAAPADFAPLTPSSSKRKKADAQAAAAVALRPTVDILTHLTARRRGLFVLGFAAETADLLAHGQHKLRQKDLDMLVANRIDLPGSGFATPTNAGLLLCHDRPPVTLPQQSKAAMAEVILDAIEAALQRRPAAAAASAVTPVACRAD